MNNFSSYGETSGFSAIPAEKLELVNGGKGESSSSSDPTPIAGPTYDSDGQPNGGFVGIRVPLDGGSSSGSSGGGGK